MKEFRFCPNCATPLEHHERYGRVRPVCPHCGRIQFFDPKVAAGVVIEQDGQLLLIQRNNDPERGKWSIPAGFVDQGEDPARAAEREALEETALVVRVTALLDVIAKVEANEGADIFIAYRAEVVSGEIMAGDDAQAARYFSAETLPELAFPSTQRVVQQWKRIKDKG